MEEKTLNQKLQEMTKSLEKAGEHKDNMKTLYKEKYDEIRERYWKMERELEEKKRIEMSKNHKEEEEQLHTIELSQKPFYDIKEDILKKFELYSIKNNLNNEEIKLDRSYNCNRNEEIEILKTENHELITIASFISENRKPTNKFDLIIQIKFKNYRLQDYFKKIISKYNNNLFDKSYKTKDECKTYLTKNYEKITKEIIEFNKELFKEINSVEIDINNEFDFMDIKYSACNRNLTPKSKNKAIFTTEQTKWSENGKKEDITIKTTITYLKDNKFEINKADNIEEIKSLIRGSHFAIEPEIIIR